MFGRQPRLPHDMILGIPQERTADKKDFAHKTRDKLQIAFELERRNLTERADNQAENNSKLRLLRNTLQGPLLKRMFSSDCGTVTH